MKTIPQIQITRAVRLRGTVLATLAACFAALLSAPPANAAAGDAVWINRYDGPANANDQAYAMAVDASGNVFVTGYSYFNSSNADYATIKYSGAGVPLWTNRYNGPANDYDAAIAVAVDGSGNVFVTGNSYDSGGVNGDYATIKYSGGGVPLWTNRYNGPGNADDYARAVAVDANGNVFVTGWSDDSGSGFDYATVAYSGAGVPLWTNHYNGPGSTNDYAWAVAADGSGNVFVTGYSYGSGSGDDYATIKYSGAGVPLWTNRYNGPGNWEDRAYAVAVDGGGNVFVTGQSEGSDSVDYATVAYSGAGVPLWTNRYDGPVEDETRDYAYAVAVDGSGNVFVTGASGSSRSIDYATIKYSGAGVPLWTNRYNGPVNDIDQAYAVAVDASGNVFVTGESFGNSADYATVAYSGAGVPLWTNRYHWPGGPGDNYDRASAMVVDRSGNVFVTGYSFGSGGSVDYATIKYAALPAPPSLQPLVQPGKWTSGTQGSFANDVKVVGNYAYVADDEAGLQVIDVSNPASPVRVGGWATSAWSLGVAVSGNYAYVADDEAGLQVIDVRNPTNCVRVGGCDINGITRRVAVSGNYAYMANSWAGFHVVDVSDPTNCVLVGDYDHSEEAFGVALSGNYAYVAEARGLVVADVSDPTNSLYAGEYDTSGQAFGVAVSGNYAYVADGTAGLQVIDVSNPTNCVRIGGYDTSGIAYGVAVSGNYAYVADGTAGLQVIDVSNPTNCVRVSDYDTSGDARGVAVVAGRIFVADGEAGLLVLPTLRDFQFSVRVNATPGTPFTLEAATKLLHPITWTPLVTTNVPAMPFDFVDFDVKLSEKPQKYYRVRQP